MISRSLTARVLAAPERILLIETEVDSHASITAYVKEEEWQNNSQLNFFFFQGWRMVKVEMFSSWIFDLLFLRYVFHSLDNASETDSC